MNKLSWLLRVFIVSPIFYWIWEAIDGSLGADPAKELNHQTGFTSLILLVINLWIGCLFWFYTNRGWKITSFIRLLLRQRRFLGVINFIFLCLHISLYLVMEGFEAKAFAQIIEKTYLLFAICASSGMLILALTSNDFSVRKLGYKKWKNIHRIVYLVFVLVLGHIFLIEKADLLLFAQVTIPLQLALIYRLLVFAIRKLKSTSRGSKAKNQV